MTFTIRPAGLNDADFIARTILAAQRGHVPRGWFDIALAWPEPRCLAFLGRIATAQSQSWWHVSQFIIADVEGQPAAALCSMPAAGSLKAARPAIEEAADGAGLTVRSSLQFQRGAYTAGCWLQADEGDWLIEHVASMPAYRGRGLVQGLIEHAIAKARAASFKQASITFLIGNDAAERCYAKAGFVFAEEKRETAFQAMTNAAGFRRFTRTV